MEYIFIGLIVLVIIILISGIKFVPQANEYVVERLGTYSRSLHAGPHYVVPFIEKVAKRVSVKEQVADFKPQPVITKDNVTMQIDTVVFYRITDSKLYTYGVERPLAAIENLTATTLRNIIGELELDATLTSRDVINAKITAILDEATDPWGIKVNRVELKNIMVNVFSPLLTNISTVDLSTNISRSSIPFLSGIRVCDILSNFGIDTSVDAVRSTTRYFVWLS